MKSISITKAALLVLVLFSANLFAQTRPAERRFVEQIKSALKSENIGVVESSIYVSLMAKNVYPEINMNKILNILDDLVNEGSSPVIKYKAQLAIIYFTYPSLFEDIKIRPVENPDVYFKQISDRLVNNTLASK